MFRSSRVHMEIAPSLFGVSMSITMSGSSKLTPGRAVCAALGADPSATLAPGCLLATCPQPAADVAVARLTERFDATVLGRVETGHGV